MAGELRGHEAVDGDTTLEADAVIVGSGPGGASVARVLAQGGLKVVVLEEGPATSNFRPNFAHTSRWHMQEGGAMVAMSTDAVMPIAAGRGMGGGSLVNSAICFRAPDHVLQGWKDVIGDDRYGPERLAEVYRRVEELVQVGPTHEGIAGENNQIIVRGAEALGYPGGLVNRNTPGCSGCGICNFGCPIGGKASMDKNQLPMAREAGALLQADTKVDTVRIEGGRAAGLSGIVAHPETGEVKGRLTVKADTVWICAGGIGTPRLLHVAGVADRLGPAVGKNLHVHPGSAIVGQCDHVVKMWHGATQGAYFEIPGMPGVLPHTFNAPPETLMLLLGKVGHDAKAMFAQLPYLCGCIVMVSDKGHGSVGATAQGRAAIRYDFADDDLDRIKAGMVETAKVLMAGGAKRVLGPVHGLGVHDDVASFEDALASRTIHDFALYAAHPMGSCRMGSDPSRSVIGATAEAHGLPGLYLADSSIFPTSLGVNPQLTTMALATAIAEDFLTAR